MDAFTQLIIALVALVISIFFIIAQFRLFQISRDTEAMNTKIQQALDEVVILLTRLAHDTRRTEGHTTSSDQAKQKLLRGQTGVRTRECPGCRAILEVPTAGAHNCPECGCAL